MPRQQITPTGRKALWIRQRRPVIVLLLVSAVPIGFFVSLGLAALLTMIALGLATFSGGAPASKGPQSPPSVPPDGGL